MRLASLLNARLEAGDMRGWWEGGDGEIGET